MRGAGAHADPPPSTDSLPSQASTYRRRSHRRNGSCAQRSISVWLRALLANRPLLERAQQRAARNCQEVCGQHEVAERHGSPPRLFT
jgi:hypothetical protein